MKFHVKYCYPLLLAAFPVLALFVNNFGETGWSVVPRPLLISMAGTGVVFGLLGWIVKDWARAALMTTWLVLNFFLYGHIQALLAGVAPFWAQKSVYVLLSLLITVLGLLLIRRLKTVGFISLLVSTIAVTSILVVSAQAVWLQVSVMKFQNSVHPQKELAQLALPADAPDIYYIILDSYTRSDELFSRFSYDNSDFIQSLQARGFYVAECTYANYPDTYSSLSSSLNANYLHDVFAEYEKTRLPQSVFGKWITDSWVENSLAHAGYKIVAFEEEWDWLNNTNADVYYQRSSRTVNYFESFLINTSSAVIAWDALAALDPSLSGYDLRAYVDEQLSLLANAQQSVALDGPKFNFIHIAIPHLPYVFQLDGPVPNLDPAFARLPFPAQYKGYPRQVAYINDRILPLLDAIIQSGRPSVILLQGDHGSRIDGNNYEILNALYFSDAAGDYPDLYPSISPVNTFRIVFNRYFDAGLDLLPDAMYFSTDQVLINDDAPLCDEELH